jgi:8-oxo-dGTP pyrophosphatase MutT (NUDIX family)
MVIITDKPCWEADAKAVLIKQTRWGLEDKTIEFPCGTVDDEDFFAAALVKNEEEFEELWKRISDDEKRDILADGRMKAAARELKEETGMDIVDIDLKHLITFNPNPAYFNNTMSIYRCTVPNLDELIAKKGEQNLDENEDCEVIYDRLLDHTSEISEHAMGIAALFAAGYHLD